MEIKEVLIEKDGKVYKCITDGEFIFQETDISNKFLCYRKDGKPTKYPIARTEYMYGEYIMLQEEQGLIITADVHVLNYSVSEDGTVVNLEVEEQILKDKPKDTYCGFKRSSLRLVRRINPNVKNNY